MNPLLGARERPEVPPQVVTDVVSSWTHAWSTVGIHIAPEGILSPSRGAQRRVPVSRGTSFPSWGDKGCQEQMLLVRPLDMLQARTWSMLILKIPVHLGQMRSGGMES